MKRPWLVVLARILLLGAQIVAGISMASWGASTEGAGISMASPGASTEGALFVASAATVRTNEIVFFDASSSRSARPVVLYEWDFDGDGAPDAVAGTPMIAYVHGDDGVFAVRLRTLDQGGLVTTSSEPLTIEVVNRVPVAAVGTLEGIVRAQLPVQFAGTASDEDGTVVAWSWAFDDGSEDEGPDPIHTYATPGTYRVRLTVTDDDGATSEAVGAVVVEDAPPCAAFTMSDAGADRGLAVWFVDTTTTSNPANVIHVGWDFGDGVYRAAGGPSADGVYAHVYESPGAYFVTLYVIDRFGAMSTTRQMVWIRG
jgi:PKD repeat protein